MVTPKIRYGSREVIQIARDYHEVKDAWAKYRGGNIPYEIEVSLLRNLIKQARDIPVDLREGLGLDKILDTACRHERELRD